MAELTINIPKPEEDPAHVEAMIAKAEGRAPASAEEAPAERPAWLPEGFNTPEELAAAYAAATKKPDATPEAETAEAAAKAVEGAGLDMAALEAKVLTDGTLADSDYEALAKVGITRAMVDGYIDGQKALGEALTARVHAHVGGTETFTKMVSWAAGGGITAAEAQAFNEVIDTGSEAQVKLALDGLKAKFTAAGQNAPNLIGGGRASASSDVYESIPQMTADMRDPRYSNDPAFRAAVEQKLARSNIF